MNRLSKEQKRFMKAERKLEKSITNYRKVKKETKHCDRVAYHCSSQYARTHKEEKKRQKRDLILTLLSF